MLSRVADSLYWMSRYLERAENTVRQLDVTMSLMLDTGGASAESALAAAARFAGQSGRTSTGMATPSRMARHAHLRQAVNPASVTSCINAARENARQVREEISTEQWQRLNRLFHQMHSPHTGALSSAQT